MMNRFIKASGERVERLVDDAQDSLNDSDQSQDYTVAPA